MYVLPCLTVPNLCSLTQVRPYQCLTPVKCQIIQRCEENKFLSSPDGLRIPKHALWIKLFFQRGKTRIHRVAVVHLVRGSRVQRRINVIQVGAKLGLRLRIDNGLIDSVDKVDRVGGVSVVLQDPEAVAVGICGKGGVLGADGGAGAAIEVNDDEVLDSVGGLEVVEERVEGVGSQSCGLGDGDGFGKEVLVLAVSSGRGLNGGSTADLGEVGNPAIGLDSGCVARKGAEKFWFDLCVEFGDGAEVSAAQGVSAVAIKIDTEGELAIDDSTLR